MNVVAHKKADNTNNLLNEEVSEQGLFSVIGSLFINSIVYVGSVNYMYILSKTIIVLTSILNYFSCFLIYLKYTLLLHTL